MQKIGTYLFTIFISFVTFSQDATMLDGRVITADNTKTAINILNLTQNIGTISDAEGFFEIYAVPKDTIIFSSIQHQLKKHIVADTDMNNNNLLITLELLINQLEEVHVSKHRLSGSIEEDVKKIKKINYKIPSFAPEDLYITADTPEERSFTLHNNAINNGSNLTNSGASIGGLISLIFNAIKKRKKAPTKAPELSDHYSTSFLLKNINISDTEIYNFVDFLNENSETKNVLGSKNELKILDFLIQQREIFNSKYTTKK